jgi:sugar/nucleoside kinase (ribokinase family)
MQPRTKAPSTVSGSRGIVKPTLVTGGFVAFDVVFGLEHPGPRIYAGGTCGNVAATFAFLGWDASPLARLSDDAAGRVVRRDLARWGVKTQYLALSRCPITHRPRENRTREFDDHGDDFAGEMRRVLFCSFALSACQRIRDSICEGRLAISL